MKLRMFAAAFAVATTTALSALAAIGPLVSPQGLVAALETGAPVVLDIRAPQGPEGRRDPDTYAGGHIAGAVNLPYGLFRGPKDNPGQVPSEASLTEALRKAGIDAGEPVVIVYQGRDSSDFGAAARVYWTLKSAGLTDLAILNGGMAAWAEAGLPVSTEAPEVVPGTIEVRLSPRWTATEQEVLAVVNGTDSALLLDARPEAFWAGDKSHDAAARPGTLPQSKYFDNAGWFDGGPDIIDAEAVRRLATAQGLSGNDQLISFCNTGHWAATNWFALSELAGIENVKLYPESMVGWSNAGHPMDNVPGPLRNLWNQIRGVF